MNEFLNLEGRRILVTGASSGIGRDSAILASLHGAQLILTGRDKAQLDRTLGSLVGSGHRAFSFDLRDTDGIVPWFRTVIAETGPLDGLVHSAGIHATVPVRFATAEHVDSVMRTNVYSAVMLAKCLSQKGNYTHQSSLVFLSSSAGIVAQPGGSVYAASKAAIIGLTKSLAVELASRGLRVNCVAPAMVHSEMTERFRLESTDCQFSALEAKHPMGLGTTRDVANAIIFLLSPASQWTTGTTLVVDGGYTVA